MDPLLPVYLFVSVVTNLSALGRHWQLPPTWRRIGHGPRSPSGRDGSAATLRYSHSPPPPQERLPPGRTRSPLRDRVPPGGAFAFGGTSAPEIKVGEYRVTIENIPDDMSWLELKDLGKEYGSSVTFAKTYHRGNTFYGMLEFSKRSDARHIMAELHGKKIQGGTAPMRVSEGDTVWAHL